MTQDRLTQKIHVQMLGAYRQSSLWLGHFYLVISIWRVFGGPRPHATGMVLESSLLCLAFYAIHLFIRPLAKALGDLDNIACLILFLILANDTALVFLLRDPNGISLFVLSMVMAGAALRSKVRFILVEALTLGAWAFSCARWLPGPLMGNFDLFMSLSGLLAGGILFGFIENLVATLSRLRAKDHSLLTQRTALVRDLEDALASVKTLRGIIPICSYCRKVRNDQGYWNQVETYLAVHSDARFSHGICPDCMAPLQASQDGSPPSPPAEQ